MSKRKMYLKMILSSFIRRKSRMIVALLAVIIGSTIMSGLITIYFDIPRQLGKEFRSYGANFICLPNDGKISEEEYNNFKELIKSKNVVGIAPYRYETTKINQKPYILAGTDMEGAKKNSPFWYVEGEWTTNSDTTEVMVGKEIANTLGLSIGDKFKVSGVKHGKNAIASDVNDSAEKSKNKDTGDDFYEVTLTVKGIITTGGKEESFIFLNLEMLNNIIEDTTKIDTIECSIEANHNELDEFSKELSGKLPNVIGSAVKRVTQSQDTVLNKLTALILLVNIVILVLTIISVSTTMMAIITERRKEIGLKKAIGAHNKEIIMDFIGESVLLGLIGGLIGVGFGFVFAQRVSLSVFGRTITFQYLLIPVIVIISVLITSAGCILPVKKAVEIDPALVLKGE
ncbi:FtsX-like permease family protein [uncultured Parvimonas sp.]|uniref:ABC transporter permease n=1 Tax=uncultured Parvimonas sp. TaxID=747372 RepID=UPI0028D84AA2|nr:FtsX-like permease family protein [uncultured Parvimonas sp.]